MAKFTLAPGYTALRMALPGGLEVALDELDVYETDDPTIQASLKANPAVVAAEEDDK